jgi:hypothetical protein
MPEEPPCDGYARIRAQAQEALSNVNSLLTRFVEPQDLQLGLQDVKQHLDAIVGDTHGPS